MKRTLVSFSLFASAVLFAVSPVRAFLAEDALLRARELAQRGRAVRVHHESQDAVHRKLSSELRHLVSVAAPAVVKIEFSPATTPGRSKGSVGTGFLISADGFLLTNAHVVEPLGRGDEVKIVPSAMKAATLTARIVARGKGGDGKDLALLKMDGARRDWPCLEFGDSDALMAGDLVVALGHPLALQHSASLGIVAGLKRFSVNPSNEYVQSTADINPGNSGGPLLTLDGRVVGVNTAIMGNGKWDGVGFALVARDVLRLLPALRAGQDLTGGAIGVNLKVENGRFYFPSVEPGGPAEKAGFRAGDVPREAAGEALSANPERAMEEFLHAVKRLAAGDSLSVVVERGGRRVPLTVVLGAAPPPPPAPSPAPGQPQISPEIEQLFREFGFPLPRQR